MTERPILFSAPMVRAILDGRKTQTRRVVKAQADSIEPLDGYPGEWSPWLGGEQRASILCPYGQPSDRLWVREAWRIGAWSDEDQSLAIDYCDGPRKEWIDVSCLTEDQFEKYWVQSTQDAQKVHGIQDVYHWEPGESPCRWRPSIHMPRWASRITLEITGCRVERLQDISEADCWREGIERSTKSPTQATTIYSDYAHPIRAFQLLWESINGPGSWAQNPWVWVVSFRRIEQ